MIFEESDEHSFPLAIVLKICSLFIYCPQSSCCTMVLKSKLLCNKTLSDNSEKKKNTCIDRAQARPTFHHAVSHARDYSTMCQAQDTLSETQVNLSMLYLLLYPVTFKIWCFLVLN